MSLACRRLEELASAERSVAQQRCCAHGSRCSPSELPFEAAAAAAAAAAESDPLEAAAAAAAAADELPPEAAAAAAAAELCPDAAAAAAAAEEESPDDAAAAAAAALLPAAAAAAAAELWPEAAAAAAATADAAPLDAEEAAAAAAAAPDVPAQTAHLNRQTPEHIKDCESCSMSFDTVKRIVQVYSVILQHQHCITESKCMNSRYRRLCSGMHCYLTQCIGVKTVTVLAR